MSKIKGKVLFNSIIVELEAYEEKSGIKLVNELNGLQGKKGIIKDFQKVVAVGSAVQEVKVGDTILIDWERYNKLEPVSKNTPSRKVTLQIEPLQVGGEIFGRITERDVIYIYDKSEIPKD